MDQELQTRLQRCVRFISVSHDDFVKDCDERSLELIRDLSKSLYLVATAMKTIVHEDKQRKVA